MPPTPVSPGRARSVDERVAELNRQIRALWSGRGYPAPPLSEAQRAEYHRLLDELDRFGRGDVTTAA